jgi:glucokinase
MIKTGKTKMSDNQYALIGDIGGTNVRFALVTPGSCRLEQVQVLPGQHYDSLESAVSHYLQGVGIKGVGEACLAIAGPVHGDRVQLTNSPWNFSKTAVRQQLQLERFKVINDFTATALGVPHVGADRLEQVGGRHAEPGRVRLVIGPGTGLGVAGLVPGRAGWIPLATEGGHVDFAPTNDIELAVFQKLRRRFGRVSAERVLSGQGLVNLYQSLATLEDVEVRWDQPREVTTAALSGQDDTAQRALALFCELFGRVAGNAALTLGALGGVYVGGGMIPRFIDFFKASGFRAAFEDKGRMHDFLTPVPVYVMLEPFTGLLGAAEALTNPEVS